MSHVFTTHNPVDATPLAPNGICNGMTAVWAGLSLVHDGCAPEHQNQIERGGAMLAARVRLARTGTFAQDAGEQWESMMTAGGLQPTHCTSTQFGGAAALAARLVSLGEATVYMVITFAAGAHAIGARVSRGSLDFFDPNTGLERYERPIEFSAGLVDLMAKYIGWTTHDTHIWTVLN